MRRNIRLQRRPSWALGRGTAGATGSETSQLTDGLGYLPTFPSPGYSVPRKPWKVRIGLLRHFAYTAVLHKTDGVDAPEAAARVPS